jgi:hypothetical protein
MKVEIFEAEELLTDIIAEHLGPRYLTPREVEMFNHAQSLGSINVALVNANFVACWGIMPPSFLSDQAYLWFWGPPVRFPTAVLRYSRKVIHEALGRYECLYGHCNVGANSIKWMQWLGAEFGSPVNGLIPFHIRRL